MRVLMLLLVAACGEDLPPPSDMMSLTPMVCRFSSGRVCGYDSLGGCPADDPINWCDCSNPGGELGCTQVAAIDGGQLMRCQATSECPSGLTCVFDPGCDGEKGRCTGASECRTGSPGRYCGCDGKPFSAVGPCADQPHSSRGGC
jgi:hypothetical protein